MEIVFPGGQKVDALYKGFRIETDQAERHGGEALAPAPFDLFLASLGTCAGIYVLSFCQERSIPTDKIRLVLRTEKDRESHMITKIEIEVQIHPDFPAKYKEAVVKAAELCTVTKHLYNPPAIEVKTAVKEGR
jgi:ribosomal protein S12 methylthiotransferase accessory factor